VPVRLTVERGPHAGVARAVIHRRAEAMLACLQMQKDEFSLVLSDDNQLHQLNKIYRGKDRPTDVLAFAMREGDFARVAASGPVGLLGDVIVSVPTARKQAAELARPLLDELTMLIAHGLLHLLGWDHDTPAKDKRMRAETERLCEAANAVDGPARPRATPKKAPAKPRIKARLTRSIPKKLSKKPPRRA
jgi:probable rRNA maturation factor